MSRVEKLPRSTIAMRLAALSAGVGADGSFFSGVVHSAFARACNIELPSGGLLGLVAREVGGVPRGFQLATPPGFSLTDYVRVGTSVACRSGILRIDDSWLSIDLRSARPWRSDLRNIGIDPGNEKVSLAWRTVWAALCRHGAAAEFARQATVPVEALYRATRTLRPQDTAEPVSSLVGLGDGLTPAGDDFLVGFLAGLWSLPPSGARRALRDAVAGAVADNAIRTGAISRLYLEAAIEGEVSEPLARLAAAIGRADEGAVANAAAAVLAVGASSGAAASYGLLLATAPISDLAIPPVL
jgi:hypothetical protein